MQIFVCWLDYHLSDHFVDSWDITQLLSIIQQHNTFYGNDTLLKGHHPICTLFVPAYPEYDQQNINIYFIYNALIGQFYTSHSLSPISKHPRQTKANNHNKPSQMNPQQPVVQLKPMSNFVEQHQANEKIRQFKDYFHENSAKYVSKPVHRRSCTDLCCLVFFVCFFGAFLIYSAYSINATIIRSDTPFGEDLEGTLLEGMSFGKMKSFVIIVLGCLGGAMFVSLVLCCMLFKIPQMTVYIMAGAGALGLIAVSVYLATLRGTIGQFSSYFFMVALFYIFFICYLHQYLQKAAILMKTIALFIAENAKIIGIVAIALLYCLLVLILWAVGFYSFCLLYSKDVLSYGGFVGSSIFWAFLLLFFNFYFYYTSVFLTSYSLAIWFYQSEQMDGLGTPLRHMVRYHIGTITFASLAISIIKIVQVLVAIARCKTSDGIVGLLGSIVSCVVCCFLGALQPLVQILNSCSIVVCALTGQSFLNSASIAGHIAFEDYQAFQSFAYTGYVLQFGATVSVSSIPTIVGAILIQSTVQNTYLVIVGSLLIMFTSTIIGQVILQVFLQSIITMYMMYRMDTELHEQGHQVTWVEQFGQEINKGFDQAFVGQIKKKPQPKYKNRTTVVVHQNGITEVYKGKVVIPYDGAIEMQNNNIAADPYNPYNGVGEMYGDKNGHEESQNAFN